MLFPILLFYHNLVGEPVRVLYFPDEPNVYEFSYFFVDYLVSFGCELSSLLLD